MPFKQGQMKPEGSGMKKGQKSKKTILLNEFLESIADEQKLRDKFSDELMNLKGKQFIDCYIKLFEFIIPKQKRIEAENYNYDCIDYDNMTEEELIEMLKELESDFDTNKENPEMKEQANELLNESHNSNNSNP